MKQTYSNFNLKAHVGKSLITEQIFECLEQTMDFQSKKFTKESLLLEEFIER